jgi:hypothetical protein
VQPVLGPRREHAVGLGDLLGDQVIHQHAQVGRVARQLQRRQATEGPHRVHAGHQALRGGLLIARRAQHLARKIKPRNELRLKAAVDLPRWHTVIFDRVAIAGQPRRLQPGQGADDRLLHIGRQAGRKAIHVDLGIVAPLRLEKQQVPLLVREAHDLVLDRRAIARPPPLDDAAEQRRPLEVRADDGVRRLVGPHLVALDLARRERRGAQRERQRLRIARLRLQLREVDRVAPQPRRRSRLQPPQREAESAQALADAFRARGAFAPAHRLPLAHMHEPAHERAGTEDDGGTDDVAAIGQADAADAGACGCGCGRGGSCATTCAGASARRRHRHHLRHHLPPSLAPAQVRA